MVERMQDRSNDHFCSQPCSLIRQALSSGVAQHRRVQLLCLAVVLASFAPPNSVGTPLGPLWLDSTSSIAVTGLALNHQGFAFALRSASLLAPADVTYVVQAGLLDMAGTASLAEPMFFGVNLQRLP